jgi:hypothetical protein
MIDIGDSPTKKPITAQQCKNIRESISAAEEPVIIGPATSSLINTTDFNIYGNIAYAKNSGSLTSVGLITDDFSEGAILCSNLPNLQELNFGNNSISSLKIKNCPKLTNLDYSGNNISYINFSEAPNLEYINGSYNSGGLSYYNFNNFAQLVSVNLLNCGASVLEISGCVNLNFLYADNNSIDYINLNGLTALSEIGLSSNLFSDLFFDSLSSLSAIYANNCNDLSNVYFSNCPSLNYIEMNNCSSLYTILWDGGISSSYMSFYGCALDATCVEDTLLYFQSEGIYDGYLDISGGTSVAPTGAGLTAKNNLVSNRGWTIITN